MDLGNDYFINRIEPVDDKQVNDKLFALYNKLIKPIKEIEDLQDGIFLRESIISESSTFRIRKLNTKIHIFIAIIIGIIGIYFAYEDMKQANEIYKNSTELQMLYADYDLFLDYYCAKEIKPLLKYVLVTDNIYDKIFGKISDTLIGIIIAPIFSFFVTSLILGLLMQIPLIILFTMLGNIKDKKTIGQCINENDKAQKEMFEIFSKIEEYIGFIPPAYRSSSALSYFVESYVNSRVSNLKEAVNAYDLYVRDARMNEHMRRVSNQLSAITFNQVTMMEQLNTLHKDIWMANFLFS